MQAIAILGGTFLLWIAARGRFSAYAALVNKASSASGATTTSSAAVAPASGSPSSGAGVTSALTSNADTVHEIASVVWDAFKTI